MNDNDELIKQLKVLLPVWEPLVVVEAPPPWQHNKSLRSLGEAIRFLGHSTQPSGYTEQNGRFELVLRVQRRAMEARYELLALDSPDLLIDRKRIAKLWEERLISDKFSDKRMGDVIDPPAVSRTRQLDLDRLLLTLTRAEDPPVILMKTVTGLEVRIVNRIYAPSRGEFTVAAMDASTYPEGELLHLVEGRDIHLDMDLLKQLVNEVERKRLKGEAETILEKVTKHQQERQAYTWKVGDLIYTQRIDQPVVPFPNGALIAVVEVYDPPILREGENFLGEGESHWVTGAVMVNGELAGAELAKIEGVLVGENFSLYANYEQKVKEIQDKPRTPLDVTGDGRAQTPPF